MSPNKRQTDRQTDGLRAKMCDVGDLVLCEYRSHSAMSASQEQARAVMCAAPHDMASPDDDLRDANHTLSEHIICH